MKKIVLSFALFIAPLTVIASEGMIEGKGAWFCPSGDRFHKIYGDTGIYGVEFTAPICNDWSLYLSGNYLSAHGRSIGQGHSTSIRLLPLSAGFKYFIPIIESCSLLDFYIGAGALATHINIHDNSPFVIPRTEKWTYGGILKWGFLLNLNEYWFIDFFGDYSFIWVHFHNTNNDTVVRNRANIGGLSLGVGLGFKFNRFFGY